MDAVRNALTKDPESKTPVDANTVVIEAFLQGFVPVDAYSPGVIVMTTDDIISALGEMVDLDQCTVAGVLAGLGFRPGRNNAGSFGWLMKQARQ